MEFFPVIVAICLSYALFRSTFSIFRFRKANNLPPGPTPLPIIASSLSAPTGVPSARLSTPTSHPTALDANEYLRTEKVKELIAYCRKANESVDFGRAAFRTSLNLLSNTVFSKDLTDPYEDSGKEFKELVGNIMIEAGKPNLVDFFPVLRMFDPQGIRRRMNRYFGKILGIFEELIKERLGTESRLKQVDMLDVCLKINRDNPEELSRSHMMMMFLIQTKKMLTVI
ncbi:hypothetical protein L1987_23341 [Smallanthus sonchifolius]|uniref:Uncharacterized protein n=1 Tax=Smallanthus sonchifolius TaxID=185202 RepID=A0ACB9IGN5_9ASTR|nr:hypothetical protein L1987_23341 [Smallanthus sonchifolius]